MRFPEDYPFCLEWDEIDDELKEAKITQYMEEDVKHEDFDADDSEMTREQYMEDWNNRKRAEESIARHFPIYF